MTASSINQRPAPFIAAAAAVAAIVAGSVALSVSHHASAPGQQQPTSVVHTSRVHHFHPTTSGGRVMLGE
jgi:hypothetical protein